MPMHGCESKTRFVVTYWNCPSRWFDGRIGEVRFRAKGCVPAMACGSLITEMIAAKTLEEARSIEKEDVVKEDRGPTRGVRTCRPVGDRRVKEGSGEEHRA